MGHSLRVLPRRLLFLLNTIAYWLNVTMYMIDILPHTVGTDRNQYCM